MTNKNVLILTFILACLVGIFGGIYYTSFFKKGASQAGIPTGLPLTLDIPAIHVHANIESVGVDKNNLMGVPHDTSDVAWYQLGPEPGALGNAVIDGHVDTQTGVPAVFAQLKNVKVGDTITISETQNIKYTFHVTQVEELPTATFPTNRVFGPANGSNLNLITCDGTWDLKAKNYSKRLVVFSKLIGKS